MSAHAKGLLEDLGDEALVRLVAALKARKVVFASNGDIEGLARLLPRPAVTTATTLLANLRSHCPDEAAAGWFLDGMLTQRGQERSRKLLDLVWTGPESELLVNRDPRVVTQDLFRSARTEILLSTFVLHLNCQVMEALADVLEGEPALAGGVAIHFDLRPSSGKDEEDEAVEAFRARRARTRWRDIAGPRFFYDPRAFASEKDRASFHAKCVVIDRSWALVTSANVTDFAQERNVEVGALVRDNDFAAQLALHFTELRRLGLKEIS